jgi:hypothetical protein
MSPRQTAIESLDTGGYQHRDEVNKLQRDSSGGYEGG